MSAISPSAASGRSRASANTAFRKATPASFALLVYVSAWLKCRYPAAFACALLNSQPMGFYAPAQIVRDAREHSVEVLPVDVNRSGWDSTLEPGADGEMALRLGFPPSQGAAQGRDRAAGRGARQRLSGPVDPVAARRPAGGGAGAAGPGPTPFGSLGLDRRRALWAVRRFRPAALPLFAAMDEDEQPGDPPAALPSMTLGEQVVDDYASVRLTLRPHPLALLRAAAPFDRATLHGDLLNCRNGQQVEIAGLVLIRQRPGTAKGVVFMTLEDEDGRGQRHRLAPCARALPADRDGRAAGPGRRRGPEGGHRHPHRRAPAGGPVRPPRRPGPA